MQILITHGSLARTRVLHFRRWQLLAAGAATAALLMLVSGAVYHFIFLKAARERWPVVGQVVRWVVREDMAQQERYMRENLDAMAQRLGEMQAKVLRLQLVGERLSGAAGVKPEELKPAAPASGAQGGAAQGGLPPLTLQALDRALAELDQRATLNADVFTLIESRLLERRLQALALPSSRPVDAPVGSGFGFRSDPFDGRTALHTGLDFPAEVGTPIRAAAGGVVLAVEVHPEYGNMLTIDHGRGLTTRYAHASRIHVAPGDLVRRDQLVAEVGSTGRSTGPHLHFEVLVDGVLQNPMRFLSPPRDAADGRPTAARGAKGG